MLDVFSYRQNKTVYPWTLEYKVKHFFVFKTSFLLQDSGGSFRPLRKMKYSSTDPFKPKKV